MNRLFKQSLLIIFLVLLADQALKFWIKTHMYLGQEIPIAGSWFIIHFVENPGMAFGMEFGGNYGKLLLSIFRIGAVIAIGYYLFSIIRQNTNTLMVIALSLIFAGAIGNIIDSIFYGVLFSSSEFQLAQFMPKEGGYGTLLHGRVVDMFYFPILRGHFPSWFPLYGGEEFEFFRPVFNLADSSISIGVAFFILFQKKIFKNNSENNTADANPATSISDEVTNETGKAQSDNNRN